MHRLIIDCDTGIDDALAVMYAGLSPNARIEALTSVWGNVPVDVAARNNLALLELLGMPDVPVAQGAAGPLSNRKPVFAPHVHGQDGQGGAGRLPARRQVDARHAANLIVDLARGAPEAMDLVAVGPLTNIALALALEPSLPQTVRSLTVMGGAADVPGNVTPAAEANIWCDPEAAAAVLSAEWDITLVPLDVTMRVLLTEEHRRRLNDAGTPTGVYAAAITDYYFDFFAEAAFGERKSPIHDVLAVATALGELEPLVAPRIAVEVDVGDGPSRGATVCDTRGRYNGFQTHPGPVQVVLEARADFADFVTDRLATGMPDRRGHHAD